MDRIAYPFTHLSARSRAQRPSGYRGALDALAAYGQGRYQSAFDRLADRRGASLGAFDLQAIRGAADWRGAFDVHWTDEANAYRSAFDTVGAADGSRFTSAFDSFR